ncbi:MAG: RHS repeat-associated core domain-containing protein, partial [Terriglobales bacterium]
YDGSGANGPGRMTGASGPSDTMAFTYDKMGRAAQVTETNGGIGPYNTSYAYNYIGEATSITAPTGRVFNYSYDADARMVQIQDASTGTAYLGSVAYNPADEVTAEKFGGNALAMSASYNNMLQPFQIAYSPSGGGGVTLQFQWGASIDASGDVTSGDNNGALRAMNDVTDPSLSMTYAYDDMNRLVSSAESDNTINVSFDIDQFGNRNGQSGTLSEPFASSGTTNQIDSAGFTYDAAGRMTEGAWAGETRYLAWDALGELTSDNNGDGVTSYAYDPFGRRISYGNGTTKHSAVYFYGAPGNAKPIAEYDDYVGQGSWQTNVLAGGTVIAAVSEASPINLTAPAAVNYLAMDNNDTTRMTVNASGTASGFGTFYPYGEPGNGAAGAEYEWTNQLRDSYGVDRFWHRDYASQLARWLSPDPAGLAAVSLADPQTWNEYSYVGNDPASRLDSLGLHDCATNPAGCNPGFYFHDGQLYYDDNPVYDGLPWQWLDPSFRLYDALDSFLPGVSGSGGTAAGPAANNRPWAGCPMGDPTAAVQLGVDVVQYFDAAGDWAVLSGGSRDWETNNPDAPLGLPTSAIGSYEGRGATSPIFPGYQAGWAYARGIWESTTYQRMPGILKALEIWTGNKYAANSGYVETVLQGVPGASASTPIDQLTASQLSELQSAQQKAEGWRAGHVAACSPGRE